MNLVDSFGWLEFLADGPSVPLAAAGRLCQATVWNPEADFKKLDGVEYIRKRK